jgi:Aromatic amino acid lyase
MVTALRMPFDRRMNSFADDPVRVGVGPVSPDDVVAVARRGAAVELTEDALAAIDRARGVVESLAAAVTPAYGVSTGFGALATRHIAPGLRAQLQRSLVRSHAAGSGPEVERAARPRSTAPPGTPSSTRRWWPRANWPPRSTTPW